MANFWQIPASDDESLRNIHKTIATPISKTRLQNAGFDPGANEYFAWGSKGGDRNRGYWNRMSEGDFCVIYAAAPDESGKRYRWLAQITDKRASRSLSNAFWDDPDFELVYFLQCPMQIDVTLTRMADALAPYGDYKAKAPLGLRRIAPAVIDTIVADLGSLNRWIYDRLLPRTESADDGFFHSDIVKSATRLETTGFFDPASLEDERERILTSIVRRRGQPLFRETLLNAYEGRCAITGCDAVAALEAAHILPYSGPKSNHASNGLLLRSDIHTLFDLNLIGITPHEASVTIARPLLSTCYRELDGKRLFLPRNADCHPNQQALIARWKDFRR
jgi:hypothetical protein